MYYAAKNMINSKSNGCLMKVMPLCIWSRKLNELDLFEAITSECRLTHLNEFNQAINYSYAYLIKLILEEKNWKLERQEIYTNYKEHISKHTILLKNQEINKEFEEIFLIAEAGKKKKFFFKILKFF